MYPGLPSRVEREIRQLYFQKIVKVNTLLRLFSDFFLSQNLGLK